MLVYVCQCLCGESRYPTGATPEVHSVLTQLPHNDIASQDMVCNLMASWKNPNKFHNYETEKITRKAGDAAEYIEMFGSSTQDRHARHL